MAVRQLSVFLENRTGTLSEVTQALSGQSGQGSDITLTVDAALSEYAYDNMGAKTGTVVLLNYKTGEILVNVSIPTFDPNTVADEEPADTSLVDRAMMGRYPPGSLMKMVTAAAAVQEGLDLTYTCSGEDVINGQRVTCSGGAHGDLTLATAFSKSCNTYFANLSVALGGSRLLTEANKFAFNTEFNFSDIVLYKSSFEVSDNEGDVAWAGIGQYHDLATPMHMAMIAGAIANDGVMMTPRLLERAQAGGYYTYQMSTAQYSRIMTADTARTLQQYMREVVRSGTGTSAAIKNANVYGKTGTAEYVDEDSGEVKNHSWFAGFIDEDEHPYAIAVIFEGAGFGSAHAAPMAAKVLAQAIK